MIVKTTVPRDQFPDLPGENENITVEARVTILHADPEIGEEDYEVTVTEIDGLPFVALSDKEIILESQLVNGILSQIEREIHPNWFATKEEPA